MGVATHADWYGTASKPPGAVWGESPEGYAGRVRSWVDQQAALDAPFRAEKREAFLGKQSQLGDATGRAAGAAGAAAGLVLQKNKFNATVQPGELQENPPEAVQIDGHARRVARMRVRVDHSVRLSEFDIAQSERARFTRLLLTCTYAPGSHWDGKHITRCLNAARQWAKRRNFRLRYVWVAELQGTPGKLPDSESVQAFIDSGEPAAVKRCVVHYHIVMWIPRRLLLPALDVVGWWPHGMTNLRRVKHGGAEGVCRYIAKYASKCGATEAMHYPKGARINGDGGLNADARQELRYWQSPYWVRDELGASADIRRTVGGWVNKNTGHMIVSPWIVWVDGAGRLWAQRKRPVGPVVKSVN